jgi:GTP-binding protein YchF
MKVGIVGLPGSGKSSLFRAVTRGTVSTVSFQSGKASVGVIQVPDRRVDFFVEEYKPKKITYASIEFVDGAAQVTHEGGKTKFDSGFFADVRQVDALAPVVRGFTNAAGEAPSPVKDLQRLRDELTLADLGMIENRIERVEKQTHGVKKGVSTPATVEMELLERLHAVLEEGKPLKTVEFTPDEEKSIRGYDFLTLKPMIAVLNIPEDEIGKDTEHSRAFREFCEQEGIAEVQLCAQVEMEISEFSDEEEAEFLQSMGIDEPARNVLIRECYRALGLISFITAGEPEVRAWTLKAGSKAVEAAGTIHSDLARGFIRIEVAGFDAVEAAGGWEAAQKNGVTALHGKDYVMQDGDVVYIRFKV